MIAITGIEGMAKMSKATVVCLLCALAVFLCVDAYQHVRKVQREAQFQRLVADRMAELQRATDAISGSR